MTGGEKQLAANMGHLLVHPEKLSIYESQAPCDRPPLQWTAAPRRCRRCCRWCQGGWDQPELAEEVDTTSITLPQVDDWLVVYKGKLVVE